jgi:hypothetical protein
MVVQSFQRWKTENVLGVGRKPLSVLTVFV